MGLNTENTSNNKPRPVPPAGLILAVCYAIIDKGTQEKNYGRGPQKNPIVEFCFELPEYTHVFDEEKGPQPLTIFQEYTVSAYAEKAKLPKVLKTWASMKNDINKITPEFLKKFIGQPCMLTVEHNKSKDGTKTYAKIAMGGLGIAPRLKQITVPAQYPKNPRLFLDLDNFDWNVFVQLPEFKQKEIAKCDEWNSIILKHPMPDAIRNKMQSNAAANTNNNQGSSVKMEQNEPTVHFDNTHSEDDPAF